MPSQHIGERYLWRVGQVDGPGDLDATLQVVYWSKEQPDGSLWQRPDGNLADVHPHMPRSAVLLVLGQEGTLDAEQRDHCCRLLDRIYCAERALRPEPAQSDSSSSSESSESSESSAILASESSDSSDDSESSARLQEQPRLQERPPRLEERPLDALDRAVEAKLRELESQQPRPLLPAPKPDDSSSEDSLAWILDLTYRK